MELDTKRIENAIIAEVSEKLIGDDALWDRAKKAFDARVDKLWVEVADQRIRSAIEDAIKGGFEREYHRTDSFGKRIGDPTTISIELEKLISGYWNGYVDGEGKPTSPGSYRAVTRAEWMMAKLCADDFNKSMSGQILSVGGALKDSLRKELNGVVNRLLSEVFRVKSLDEQKGTA